MSFALTNSDFLFLPPLSPPKRALTSRHHRLIKRRLSLHCQLNPSLDSFFQSLIAQFPSPNAFNYIAPALGFASGVALYLNSNSQKLLQNPNSDENWGNDVGEWILFTSPTPFNRFVTLRCPSIYFPGNEVLEDVNERLVKEERHYVKVNGGRMVEKFGVGESMMVYQRVCVGTEDGGVLSLDWPSNLEMEEERGLDTTVLIVPGTAEGSNEREIRTFVCECLRRGVFPVVMNPRGCAGSPLTTARLFTAADSDDISTALQFINKKRPWTSLMGVGWGYGANMLTKYLSEVGERTPLTAATCIDNPFDLEETTRFSAHHMDFDQKHTRGLISILQSNKELFQGRGKRFDVESALSASSVREFEKSISMVSNGFDNIEDFYGKSSTRDVVGKVKIPVLFIQNDDGNIPIFSIPRGLIAENPYTSLLLCSYSPSNKNMDGRLKSSWCQNLAIEWLAAVELGLLKGRHPLLKDVHFTINPSKGLSFVEREASSKSGRVDTFLNLTNGYSKYSPLRMPEANEEAATMQPRFTRDVRLPSKTQGLEEGDNSVGNPSSTTIDAEIVEEGANSFDDEGGQVLQSAQVVMNMLDITMPDILSDEEKKKVLTAVGQGETIMKALQDAVPEDVRGKLTSAVSGILQSRGSGSKFDRLLSLESIPDMASELNSKVLEKITPSKANVDIVPASDQKKSNDPGSSTKIDVSSDKPPETADLQNRSSEDSKNSIDTGTIQSTSNDESNSPDLQKVNLQDTENSIENEQLAKESKSDAESMSEMKANPEFSSLSEGPGGTEDIAVDQKRVGRDGVEVQSDQMEENNKHEHDLSGDSDNMSEAHHTEEQSSAPSPALNSKMTENETENNDKKEEKGTVAPPSFNVSQALDAFAGFDDSTQVAVNSVFNVIEDMIDKFEEEKDNENEVNNENNKNEPNEIDEVKEVREGSVSEDHPKNNKSEIGRSESLGSNQITQSGRSDGKILHDSAGRGYTNGKQNSNSSDTSNRKEFDTEDVSRVIPAAGKLTAGNAKFLNSSDRFPSFLTSLPYGDPLYKEYVKAILYFKMRNAKPQDVDKISAFYRDYIPEEGRRKFLKEQTADNSVLVDEFKTHEGGYSEDQIDLYSRSKHTDNIIETSYVILGSGEPLKQKKEPKEISIISDNIEPSLSKFNDSMPFIKSLILECLNVEVGRRASASDIEEVELQLARDIEYVANTVSVAAVHGMLHMSRRADNRSDKLSTLDAENLIEAISSAVQDTQYLRRVVPVGVITGSTLAALRKYFDVSVLDGNNEKESSLGPVGSSAGSLARVGEKEGNNKLLKESENIDVSSSLNGKDEDKTNLENSKNNDVMVGAVTAALGASALLVHQRTTETDGTLNEPLKEKENSKEPINLEEMSERAQNNMVTSLAEKAMSVASPVVPTKEDGEVDHERLVAMLAEVGQKGGILKLVGNVALLWGGIRGAMSLTDKLLSFLRIAERPLFQRIPGFVFMVLLLWSPVVVPMFPSLMRNWATRNPLKIAELTCIAGLYVSIMIMVTLWGKRIRKHDDPLLQYGLDLTSIPKFQNFLKGLVGGVTLVVMIHTVNYSLGCVLLSWPATLPLSSSEPVLLIKSYGRMLMLIVKGIATAIGVATVEELLFRSWLPQEIEADLGYHRGIIISGLVFALSQRSTWEIPGLWLLSLCLSGAQQRAQGSLSLPIGLRTGILASNFILKTGGFLSSQSNYPLWIAGAHPLQPFSGVAGLAFSLVLAIILYPRKPIPTRKTTRTIRP